MSDEWAFKPHIKIPAENIKKRPKKINWPPPPDEKEYDIHGDDLKKQLEESIKYCNRENKLVDEDYVLTVKTENNISTEDEVLNRLGFVFSFQINENTAIVTLEKNRLNKMLSELNIYTKTNKLKTYYNKILSINIEKNIFLVNFKLKRKG